MNSPKTIRLQNLAPGSNLSLHLHQNSPVSVGSMKRGVALTPILIPAGAYFDVCVKLQVSLEEARSIVARSPEVKQFIAKGVLKVIEFPPPPEVASPPPAVLPPMVVVPVEAATVAAADVPAPLEMTATPGPEAEAAVTAAVAPAVMAPAAEAETEVESSREPSMDWSEDSLRAYAAKHDIDVSYAKSKTGVLRAIRGAR